MYCTGSTECLTKTRPSSGISHDNAMTEQHLSRFTATGNGNNDKYNSIFDIMVNRVSPKGSFIPRSYEAIGGEEG